MGATPNIHFFGIEWGLWIYFLESLHYRSRKNHTKFKHFSIGSWQLFSFLYKYQWLYIDISNAPAYLMMLLVSITDKYFFMHLLNKLAISFVHFSHKTTKKCKKFTSNFIVDFIFVQIFDSFICGTQNIDSCWNRQHNSLTRSEMKTVQDVHMCTAHCKKHANIKPWNRFSGRSKNFSRSLGYLSLLSPCSAFSFDGPAVGLFSVDILFSRECIRMKIKLQILRMFYEYSYNWIGYF